MLRVQPDERPQQLGALGGVVVAHRQHGEVVQQLRVDRTPDRFPQHMPGFGHVSLLEQGERPRVFF